MRFPWIKQKPSSFTNAINGVRPDIEIYLAYDFYSLSETGPTRTGNEDAIVCFYPQNKRDTVFAMVADGMGGHSAGEVASSMACNFAKEFVYIHFNGNTTINLSSMLENAHVQIVDAASANAAYKGMGTTATALIIHDQKMKFGHVGDSRLYLLREQKIKQITTDHTLVNQWLLEGKITAAEAINHPNKNVITQALGTTDKINPEIGSTDFPVKNGDRFFMCSDGIYDVLTDEELQDILNMASPTLAMDCIKLLCNARKANDNFSAILIAASEKKTIVDTDITKEQNIPT